jgi:prepilin-type N-terminal cleavage/methylation domain-containing protein
MEWNTMEVKQIMIASKRKPQNGFTIIEVMIAVVISSILTAAVYQTFHSQQRSYAMQSEAAAMEQNLRGSLYLLTKELRSAGYNPQRETNNNFRFVTSFPAPNNLFTVNYADDHFTVAFTLDTDGSGGIESNKNEQIAYKFDKNTKTLQRFNDSQPDITKKWEIVASNIDAVYFMYYDDKGAITANPVDIEYVEISMLARTSKQDSKYTDTTVYTNKEGVKLCLEVMKPDTDKCPNDSFGDHYRRRLLTTTIQIRNKLIEPNPSS